MSDQPDIDPGWYPGQLETAGGSRDQNVPSVLTKLSKWGDYESIGEPVKPTKFIPMKTPLSNEILSQWSLQEKPKHSLTVQGLLDTQRLAGREIGLILDLSNHECLYTREIPSELQYQHIKLVAKELPPTEFVSTVSAQAQEFWRTHPEKYIAIHCAYGFNRTGFVVCCYLIEVCRLCVDDALAAFVASRPPGVRHQQFRAELFRRYESPCTRWPLDHPAYEEEDEVAIPGRSAPVKITYSPHGSATLSGSPPEHSAGMSPTMSENESLGAGEREILHSFVDPLHSSAHKGILHSSLTLEPFLEAPHVSGDWLQRHASMPKNRMHEAVWMEGGTPANSPITSRRLSGGPSLESTPESALR